VTIDHDDLLSIAAVVVVVVLMIWAYCEEKR
jgi:hypothetical protein